MKAKKPLFSTASTTSRRKVLAQLAAGALPLAMMNSSQAGMPLPAPLTLEEEIRYHGRWIFTGRLKRVVFLSLETEKNLFTPGAPIDSIDFKLYERHETKVGSLSFLEIENAVPVLMNPDIPAKEIAELATGNVYCRIRGLDRIGELNTYIASMVGKRLVFFLRGRMTKLGAAPFPYPLYDESTANHWRDNLPLPIEELPKVEAVALRLGIVRPAVHR